MAAHYSKLNKVISMFNDSEILHTYSANLHGYALKTSEKYDIHFNWFLNIFQG